MKQNQPVDGYVTLEDDKDTNNVNNTVNDVTILEKFPPLSTDGKS